MSKIAQNQISKIKFILRCAKDNYIIVSITINDYLLNENNIFELFTYIDRIGFPVDSSSKKYRNADAVESFVVAGEQCKYFQGLNTNIMLSSGTKPIFESKHNMVNSYFMLEPSRNMFTNHGGKYKDIPLTTVNSENMLCLVNPHKYIERGDLYE